MSRSSKGFADFFPTAPSVLQQKRSKFSQERRPHHSSPINLTPAVLVPSDIEPEGSLPSNGQTNGELAAMPRTAAQEDNECANGDISHEVGSASSTSTASSIFSAGQRDINITYHSGPHKSTSLTPLTNIDSSPQTSGINPSPKRLTQDQPALPTERSRSPFNILSSNSYQSASGTLTISQRPDARPGRGVVKGFKAIYDPDLDKALRGKDKKSRQPQFQPFGEEVSSHFLAYDLCMRCRCQLQTDCFAM